ncbi:unnamed protein product [Owenia fusiformis]|uniref:Uncharacterized protein n=1 Tax=Owenia fusiformis TaxID=6347 RepID=A0A8J1XPE6_OWEFU|nr:unnamed protein product [Owenia fusiformis]
MPPAKKRIIKYVQLNGAEKRYVPNKHYMYILQIKWESGNKYIVYRKYSDFFDFHEKLTEMFPIEAGVIDERQRILPALPSRKLFQRSEVKKVASEREVSLGEYCKRFFKLEEKICQNEFVHTFFEPSMEDINPPKDASKKPVKTSLLSALLPFSKNKKELVPQKSVPAGLGLNVDQTMDTGDAEDMDIGSPMSLDPYRAISDYKAADKSGVSFSEGQLVDVVEKNPTGWWFVQVDEKQGWAPASYLDPIDSAEEADDPAPNYTVNPNIEPDQMIATKAYEAKFEDEVSFNKGTLMEVMHKLLDGWWIVNINGQVGYAPAAYLAPITNPHMKNMKASFKVKEVVPTPRRRTIKNIAEANKKPARDLTIYRKMSKKRMQTKQKKQAPMPPQSAVANTNEEFDQIYSNDTMDQQEFGTIYEEILENSPSPTGKSKSYTPLEKAAESGPKVEPRPITDTQPRKKSSTEHGYDRPVSVDTSAGVDEEIYDDVQGEDDDCGQIYENPANVTQINESVNWKAVTSPNSQPMRSAPPLAPSQKPQPKPRTPKLEKKVLSLNSTIPAPDPSTVTKDKYGYEIVDDANNTQNERCSSHSADYLPPAPPPPIDAQDDNIYLAMVSDDSTESATKPQSNLRTSEPDISPGFRQCNPTVNWNTVIPLRPSEALIEEKKPHGYINVFDENGKNPNNPEAHLEKLEITKKHATLGAMGRSTGQKPVKPQRSPRASPRSSPRSSPMGSPYVGKKSSSNNAEINKSQTLPGNIGFGNVADKTGSKPVPRPKITTKPPVSSKHDSANRAKQRTNDTDKEDSSPKDNTNGTNEKPMKSLADRLAMFQK